MSGSVALAATLPGTTCPPGFNCFSLDPRDGACQHPAVIFDEKEKSTRYEGDRFSSAYEKTCIAQTNSSAVRRGLELRLKFGNGTSRVYKNNYTSAACEQHQDTCKTYFLYDFFPQHSLFLINVGYNESQEWFLISQADGKEQEIIAPPRYSPSRKWLASVYATEGGDDGNNGIDIFAADLNPTEPGFQYRPKEYEQWEFAGWDGDDHLLLKVTWRAGNNPELVEWPAEVVRVSGKWQLNKWAPGSSRPDPTSVAADAAVPVSKAKSCGESFPRESTAEDVKKCIAMAGPLAAMRGEKLVLRMDDGSRKIFDNKTGSGVTAGGFGYGLADFYPSTHIFVVCDYADDTSHCIAVDGKTGRQLDFGYLIPKFSPVGNWALTIEYGEDGVTASSFEIRDVRGKKPLKVWSSKASKTRLPARSTFVTWDDDKTIRLAGPDAKPVFLVQAADGTWGVSTTPGN